MKPLIGITSGEFPHKHPWAPLVYGQAYTYTEAVRHAGGVPVILPISTDETQWRELFDRCDGLLFAGGNDIDPSRYGEAMNGTRDDFSKNRDAQEFALIELALKHDKPVLGICRGMEVLNVALGGSLYQDVPSQLPDMQNHEASLIEEKMAFIAHQLKIDEDSKLAEILQVTTIPANTHHHQAVHKLGKDLKATAWAEDGIVEALELPNKKFVLGVQLHPEALEDEIEPRWRKLFGAFIAAATP